MAKPLTFGSLFSGVGLIDLGFELAGWESCWMVEKDKYAQAVLRRHWPDVPLFTDVLKVGRDDLTSVDCIVGGFPCQDVSLAGFRAGLAGKRSGLWWEFYRIISEVWVFPRRVQTGTAIWLLALVSMRNADPEMPREPFDRIPTPVGVGDFVGNGHRPIIADVRQ